MAQPIPLELAPRDPRAELQTRLQNAPVEHAEALLAAYQVLQGMHDRGVFDLLRGALGSSDHALEAFVEAAKSPESIRSIRNFIILARTFGEMDPELVRGFTKSLPEAIAATRSHDAKPPSLWAIFKRFQNPEFRRGLVLVNSLLEAFGRNLPAEKPGVLPTRRD